jgi:DNA polymerase V
VPLPYPTDDTLLLGKAAIAGLRVIYREGFRYKKSGTALLDLSPKAQRQATLFEDRTQRDRAEQVGALLDRINGRFGKQTISLAGAGIEKAWKLKAENRSPSWTTSWRELPTVA